MNVQVGDIIKLENNQFVTVSHLFTFCHDLLLFKHIFLLVAVGFIVVHWPRSNIQIEDQS